MKRCRPECIADRRLGPRDQERFDTPSVRLETRFMESRIAVMIRGINSGAALYQQMNKGEVSSSRCCHERGRALSVTGIDTRAHIEQQSGLIH